jgi:hypothetical protein
VELALGLHIQVIGLYVGIREQAALRQQRGRAELRKWQPTMWPRGVANTAAFQETEAPRDKLTNRKLDQLGRGKRPCPLRRPGERVCRS